ncbi:MAG: lysophospholipid acyltransferase family protein [Armatimonadetes bacterium]|nr:lysophospholipid acyltransferase family protein [Armatimonadota bacterium]
MPTPTPSTSDDTVPFLPLETPKKSRSRHFQKLILAMIPFVERRVQKMPRLAALEYGAKFGELGYRFANKARETAYKNLRFVYGDALTQADRERIVRGVFRHFGRMGAEFLRGPLIKTAADFTDLVESVEGWDEHIAPLQEADGTILGRGLVFCTGHIGNWELLGRYMVSRGIPLTVVARDPEDPGFAAWAKRMRQGAGFGVSAKGESAKKLISALRRGEAVALLHDQSSGDVFIPFFGVPAGTAWGPALLAHRTNALVITCAGITDPAKDYRYRFTFDAPLAIPNTGDKEADYTILMTQANERLEARIRQHPEQWLWLHDRWKATFQKHNRERLPEGLDLAALWERFV